MKYKKVIIFLTLVLGAAVFCKVRTLTAKPHDTVALRQEVQAAADERGPEESERIAVVNLDEGVRGNGGQVNYAQKLSRFPTMDFEYSSLEAAREGMKTGRYGAYIIIPAVFSENVESINSAPQTSQLEYAVNRSYSEERQYELLYNVRSYIDSLNDRLSYMYVDNILKEFHEAQDYADSVMENDSKDRAAIEKIASQELVGLIKLPEFQMEENTVELPDIQEYSKRTAVLADVLKEEYTGNVQRIQSWTDGIHAEGMALSERLHSLSAEILTPDLTVDENGESITEKADDSLRAELERQAECLPEKEAASQCLRKILKNHQKLREILEQISGQSKQSGQSEEQQSFNEPVRPDEDPEQSGEDAVRPDKEPEQSGEDAVRPDKEPEQSGESSDQSGEQNDLLACLEEEEQEIRGFLEEIEKAGDLDVEGIIELVRTEYSEPLKARAEETVQMLRQRQEEEAAAVASYNEQIAGFWPQINDQFISRNVQEMADSNMRMQDTLLKSSQAYMEYARRSADSARRYADELQKNAEETRRKSEQTIADSLKEARKVKKETSLKNQKILGSFASKLPYTRTGRAENTQVYQFIVNPLTAEDQSEEQESYFFIRRRKYEH